MPIQLNGNQVDAAPSPMNKSTCGHCCPTRNGADFFFTPAGALWYVTNDGSIYVIHPFSDTAEKIHTCTHYYPYVPAVFGYRSPGDFTDRRGKTFENVDLKTMSILKLPKPYHSYLEEDDFGDPVRRTEFVGFQDSEDTCIVWRIEYGYETINGEVTLTSVSTGSPPWTPIYRGQYDGAGTPLAWSSHVGPCADVEWEYSTSFQPLQTFQTDDDGNPVYVPTLDSAGEPTGNGTIPIDSRKEKEQWYFEQLAKYVADCTLENSVSEGARNAPHWVMGTDGIRTAGVAHGWRWEICEERSGYGDLDDDLPELRQCVDDDDITPDCAMNYSANRFELSDDDDSGVFPKTNPGHFGISDYDWEHTETMQIGTVDDPSEITVSLPRSAL